MAEGPLNQEREDAGAINTSFGLQLAFTTPRSRRFMPEAEAQKAGNHEKT
jgi:hypothetical protein